MAYEPQPNKTNLFRNDRKEQETHADWQATVEIDGKNYYINGWDKQGSKGPFISLSFKEKVTKLDNMRNEQQAPTQSFDDDTSPF